MDKGCNVKKKILIPTKLDAVARETLERHGGYTVVQDDAQKLPDLATAHPDTHAIIVRSEKVGPDVIDRLPKLKVVVRAGAGYDTIDIKYARKKKVDVMNTPGANANAVAEEVVALMLADARHLVAADPSTRAGKWEKNKFMGREISHKTLGIVGLGYIGQTLVRRLRGFEMRLLGYDPVLSREKARDLGVELVDLEELFRQADYVSLHVPENDQTRGMVNATLLSLMKPGATIINCARSGVVDLAAVKDCKSAKRLRLLNDVYDKDEAGPKPEAEVADLMMPHIGASTQEANENAARRAAEQLIEFDEKSISTYIVNRDVPAGLDEAYGELVFILARLARALVGPSSHLKILETSFYGSLKPYSNWLLMPMLAALSEDFDRSMDYAMALEYLKSMGIEYENRATDDSKGFKNSVTLDMSAAIDTTTLRHVSVRGTVAEGNIMVSRIDDFDKLYFDPHGRSVIFIYEDRPGVLSRIASSLAAEGINIDDVRNPHDSKGKHSIAILKVNQTVPASLIARIGTEIQASTACYAEL